jgi:hypothetical protein
VISPLLPKAERPDQFGEAIRLRSRISEAPEPPAWPLPRSVTGAFTRRLEMSGSCKRDVNSANLVTKGYEESRGRNPFVGALC